MGYQTGVIRLLANVGGTEVDVVAFKTSYDINAIPTAQIMLPPGREVQSLGISNAHSLTGAALDLIPTTVYLEMDGGGDFVGSGTQVLFEGWAIAVGYHQSYSGVGIILTVVHWLSALTFTSATSASSMPTNPAQFSFNATVIGDGVDSKGAFEPVAALVMPYFGNPARLSEDMWGNSLLPFFKFLTSQDRLYVEKFGAMGGTPNDSENGLCSKTLDKFAGDTLPLDIEDDNKFLAIAIAKAVGEQIMQASTMTAGWAALAQTNIWFKLLEVASSFHFAVVPFPQKAMVVPFVAGLRTPLTTIYARDIDSYNATSSMRYPIRAVGVQAGINDFNGALGLPNDFSPSDPRARNIGGWYQARDDGVVQILPAPQWAALLVSQSAYAKDALPADKTRANSFNHPRAGSKGAVPTRVDVAEKKRTLLDKFAHSVYVTEVLSPRTGSISGPLRLDICPGSTIAIEGTAGAFTAGSDPQGETHYASVARVVINIDAQRAEASTQFSLDGVRTAGENARDDTSIARHPLFKRVWSGDRLV